MCYSFHKRINKNKEEKSNGTECKNKNKEKW